MDTLGVRVAPRQIYLRGVELQKMAEAEKLHASDETGGEALMTQYLKGRRPHNGEVQHRLFGDAELEGPSKGARGASWGTTEVEGSRARAGRVM